MGRRKKQENKLRQDKRLCLQVEETLLVIVEIKAQRAGLLVETGEEAGLSGRADDEVS